MPSYIIASNNEDDLGYIKDINLCPYFSTTYCTVQVQNISTLANFQILTEEDTIEFRYGYRIGSGSWVYSSPFLTFTMGDQPGVSYVSLPNLINTYLKRAGETFTCMFYTLHRIVFIYRPTSDPQQEVLVITSMSYGFQTLLGYTGVTFPIKSHDKTMWVGRKSNETDERHITGAEWDFPVTGGSDGIHYTCQQMQCRLTYMEAQTLPRDLYCCFPVKVQPEGFWNYRIQWAVNFHGNTDTTQFMTILPDSGTGTVLANLPANLGGDTGVMQCNTVAKVYEGSSEVPSVTLEAMFRTYSDLNLNTEAHISDNTPMLIGASKMLFSASTRLCLCAKSTDPQYAPPWRVTKWEITSSDLLAFYGTQDNEALDEHNILQNRFNL